MSDVEMRYDEAVVRLFENGAEMVVVVNQPESLHCRGIILDGLRTMTGEQNLERAAGVADAEALERYLIYSAIHGGMTGT
jgi:hypothetical protein